MVIPQRRISKTEATLQIMGKLLQDHPELQAHIYAQNADQLKQTLPTDVQSRVSVDAPPKLSPAEELSASLRPLVCKWIAERPVEIRLGAFFQRFPEIPDTFLTEKVLMPMLAEYNPEYRGSWIVDEWDYVPHDLIMKLIKPIEKHSKNDVE